MLGYMLGKLWPDKLLHGRHYLLSKSSSSLSPAVLNSNEASISNIVTLNYTWTINNFSVDRREALRSPNFGPSARDPLQFNLKLYPRGLDATDSDYIALFLKLAATDKDQVNVYYKLSIIDQDGSKRNIFGNGQMHSFVRGGLGWGWSKFVHRDKLNPTTSKGLLHGNSLVINCEVIVIPSISVPCEDPREALNEPSQDFSPWYLNETLSDVVLLVGKNEEELPAHKFVLANRSSIFADMFEDTKKSTDITQLKMKEDIPKEVVVPFLEYIYTGKVTSIENFASRLLLLANEYQMEHLKAMCEKSLCSQLDIESALSMLTLAQEQNVSMLKTKTLDFIREQILDSVEYKNDLLVRAFRSFVIGDNDNWESESSSPSLEVLEASVSNSQKQRSNTTPAKVLSFSHIWRIENFSHLCDSTVSTRRPTINSCRFGPLHNDPPQFQLEIQPRSKVLLFDKWVSLFFNIVPNKDEKLLVNYSFSILDGEEKRYTSKGYNLVKSGKKKRVVCPWFIKRSHLSKKSKDLLPNDTLTILCEGRVISSRKKAHASTKEQKHANKTEAHCGGDGGDGSLEEYSDWYLSESLSDVLVLAGGKQFCAHKLILSMSSPVFAAMFQHDMKENLENRVELKDVDEDVAEHFLAYFYTGKVRSMAKFATELLILADKFQVDSLKKLCEQYLCTKVDYSSVLDLVELAENYNALELKESAQDFIRESTLDTIEVMTDQKTLVAAFRDLVLEE